MPAYVVLEIEVTDPVLYEEYKKLAPAAVAQYGGKYLARGGKTVSMEGGWNPARLVILEFESLERARQWYDSPEYAGPRKMREQATRSKTVMIEGVTK